MISYPSQLPRPLIDSYKLNTTNPLMRSEMNSGRARQRRKFTSVPTTVKVRWNMDRLQAGFFEAWYARTLLDGAEWFVCELETTAGFQEYECRFTGIYDGPEKVQVLRWEFSATLELRERPLIPSPWEQFPEYWFAGNIIDLALNREWPEA